uniref:Uncharacterized protein n=1 Tax=Anguilla anguilla TaxID=7936 RepID=A0A0E9QSG8_ANGAN
MEGTSLFRVEST